MKTSSLIIASLLLGLLLGAVPSLAEFRLWRGSARFDDLLDTGTVAPSLEPPPPGDPTPRVEVDSTEYDFGAMQRESSKSHDFVFTNNGQSPLKLLLGDKTCKCTLSKLAKDTIPPGESAVVTLEWKAITRGEEEFRQQAAIHTNDPENEKIVLTVFGKVVEALSIVPRDLVFSNVAAASAAESTILVASYVEEDLDLVEHRLDNQEIADFFEIEVEPIPPEEYDSQKVKRAWRIHVQLKPGLPIGPFTQTLRLVTTSADFGVVDISIRGMVTGNTRIVGRGWNKYTQTLDLDTVHKSAGKQMNLTILVRGEFLEDAGFRVAEVTPEQLTARVDEVKPLQNGNSTKVSLRIEVPQGAKTGAFLDEKLGKTGQILLESNHPSAKSLKIPVRFAVID